MARPNKVMISLRVTPEVKSLLETLAEKMQLNQVDVVETAVKQLAKRQAGINQPDIARRRGQTEEGEQE